MALNAFAQQAAFAQSQRNGLMWMGQSALSSAHAQSARNGWMGQFLWHEPRIHSRRSVSEADFPAYWAAHWKAQDYGVVSGHAPDSIPGALAAARARMGALTGERA